MILIGSATTERDLVIETVNRLFIATDNRDWDGVRAVFAPRVRFDMTLLASAFRRSYYAAFEDLVALA